MSPREILHRRRLASLRYSFEPIDDPAEALVSCPRCDGDPECELCQGSGEVTGQEAADHYQDYWEPNWSE